ncbi:MAG: NAD-dependent epimerase/dehydratase family protein [Lactobacillales bacterium]|jgi:UDP-glucose 4-epimerase|nr:NAD-dependent epimerase/dehydratase family protein [Lactobacillales bacterium]
MKLLITGANSFIGRHVALITGADELDVKNENWKNTDFTKYDAILHVAAIVHQKEEPEMQDLYKKVNTDLPVEIAQKSGVKNFIFMSTMAVYGENGELGKPCVITKQTPTNPKTMYAKTKLEAEKQLADLNINLAILRPPMVYGENAPGNSTRLEKLAKKLPVFPDYQNERSMVEVNKLAEIIKDIYDNKKSGIFFPQDDEYTSTSAWVKALSNNKIHLSKLLGKLVPLGKNLNVVKKIFGNLTYER